MSLRDDEGWAWVESEGQMAMPVWPEADFAAICASDNWSGYAVQSIPLADFLEEWLPNLENDDLFVAIFSTASGNGVVVRTDRLAEDVRAELSQYE